MQSISEEELFQKKYDRQMRIKGWDQKKVSSQICLLLGIGGLGSTVAIGLARLGVKKLIMIDYDKVEYSNLNRQVLFKLEDVGSSKVEAAAKNLKALHDFSNSEIYNLDVIKNWGKVVNLAKESTVIFNMIDYGDYCDAAIQSLAINLGIPLIMGGTFCQVMTVDFFYPQWFGGCYICSSDLKKEKLDHLSPSKISDYQDLSFLPKNNNPIGQSNYYLASLCANAMISRFSSYLMKDKVKGMNRLIFSSNEMDSDKFDVLREKDCPLCSNVKQEIFQLEVLRPFRQVDALMNLYSFVE